MKKGIQFIWLFLLCTLCGCTSMEPLQDGELRVHIIDVGQADSILVQLPSGQNMLIDAGTNQAANDVLRYLDAYEIDKIDYLVATHPHEDHIGGMDEVIEEVDIGAIYMPKVEHTTKTYENLLTAIAQKRLKVKTAAAGVQMLDEQGVSAEFIAPAEEYYDELNNYSAVLKLTYGNRTFLLMGDAEKLVEGEITADVSADVLKVGHHGSNTSSTAAFLKKVRPEYAAISVGEDNDYNHPSKKVVRRLESVGATVLRTDLNGSILFSTDGSSLECWVEEE